MKRLFEIQTLSERCTPRLSARLGDPVSIILGGIPAIMTLFPNWFPQRKQLEQSDWIKFFPGNGYWTVKLRDYLANHIQYDVDLKNVTEYTRYFVYDNRFTLMPNYQPGDFEAAFKVFSDKIAAEARGISGSGNYPIISAGMDTTTLLIIGGGVLALALLAKKKNRKRK